MIKSTCGWFHDTMSVFIMNEVDVGVPVVVVVVLILIFFSFSSTFHSAVFINSSLLVTIII